MPGGDVRYPEPDCRCEAVARAAAGVAGFAARSMATSMTLLEDLTVVVEMVVIDRANSINRPQGDEATPRA